MRLPSGAVVNDDERLEEPAVDPVRLVWLVLSLLAIFAVTIIAFWAGNTGHLYIISGLAIVASALIHIHESLMELPRRAVQVWWYIAIIVFYTIVLDPMDLQKLIPALHGFPPLVIFSEVMGVFQCLFILVGFFFLLTLVWRLPKFLVKNGWATFQHGAFVLPLQRELHAKGYTWLTTEMALKLYRAAGSRARRLPPWEEVGIIPGCSGKKRLETVIMLAKLLPKRRRKIRRATAVEQE